jgi:hypothetical protein
MFNMKEIKAIKYEDYHYLKNDELI